MSPGNGKGRPRQGDPIPSNVHNLTVDDLMPPALVRAPRRTDLVIVWAHVYLVVGHRGRCRSVIVVACCAFCGWPHVHNGKPDFVSGRHKASCHEGRYLVHLGAVEGQVAA